MADTAGYISTRQFGQATVSVISEGTLRWMPEIQVPEAELHHAMPEIGADGTILLGLNLVHIHLGDASVLVDPGFDEPASEAQRRFALKWPGATRSPGLQAALATVGTAPDEITHVVFSHAHDDHFAGATIIRQGQRVPRYGQARHFLGRGDWEGNAQRQEPESETATHLETLDRLGLLELVEGEQEIVPGITMILLPGESPGHAVVRVESEGQAFFYVGDLFHHRCEIEHPDWPPRWGDHAALLASRERLIAEAIASHATVVFTHASFPAWGSIVDSGAGIRWEPN